MERPIYFFLQCNINLPRDSSTWPVISSIKDVPIFSFLFDERLIFNCNNKTLFLFKLLDSIVE